MSAERSEEEDAEEILARTTTLLENLLLRVREEEPQEQAAEPEPESKKETLIRCVHTGQPLPSGQWSCCRRPVWLHDRDGNGCTKRGDNKYASVCFHTGQPDSNGKWSCCQRVVELGFNNGCRTLNGFCSQPPKDCSS
jgi:hypothetical protein